jgi:amidohydrolase
MSHPSFMDLALSALFIGPLSRGRNGSASEESPGRPRRARAGVRGDVMKQGVAFPLLFCACTNPTPAAPVASAADATESPAVAAESSTVSISLIDAIAASAERLTAELIAFRRDLHRYPELSGKEERTAERIAGKLVALGLEVRTGVGGHGVVGVLRGGLPGPVVAYRADMDAVAGDEPAGREYGSRVPGVYHICGHDLHSAIGVGVASVLANFRAQLPGTAMFVFQPAEETLEGARAMLADHALADFAPAAIYALHTGPLVVGTFGLNADHAGQDHFKATLLARPAAAAVERAVARLKALGTASPPGSSAEHTEGSSPTASARPVYAVIHADATGAHPRIEGWLRTRRDEDYPLLRAEVRAILDAELTAAAFRVEFADAPFPSMRSNRSISERARPALIRAVGEANVISIDSMHLFNGEDFALWLQRMPGAMFIIGVANPKRAIAGVPHAPDYDADEAAIPLGTKAMSLVLWHELSGGKAAH